MRRALLILTVLISVCSTAFADDCIVKPIQVKAVCGKVVDLFNGLAIADIQVQLLRERGEAIASSKSDANGEFSFLGIHTGNYELVFTSNKWPTLRWPIQVSESDAKKCGNPFYVSLWNRDSRDRCASKVTTKKPWPVNDHL